MLRLCPWITWDHVVDSCVLYVVVSVGESEAEDGRQRRGLPGWLSSRLLPVQLQRCRQQAQFCHDTVVCGEYCWTRCESWHHPPGVIQSEALKWGRWIAAREAAAHFQHFVLQCSQKKVNESVGVVKIQISFYKVKSNPSRLVYRLMNRLFWLAEVNEIQMCLGKRVLTFYKEKQVNQSVWGKTSSIITCSTSRWRQAKSWNVQSGTTSSTQQGAVELKIRQRHYLCPKAFRSQI